MLDVKNDRHLDVTGSRKRLKATQSDDAFRFLQYVKKQIANKVPNKTQFTLPATFRKLDVYSLYKKDFEVRKCTGNCLSEGTFVSIWTKKVPELTIPKQDRFSRCADCSYFQMKLADIKLCDQDRVYLRLCKGEHDRLWIQERHKYYARREKSKRNQENYLCIMIDGMESSDAILPHYVPFVKNVSCHALAEMRIVGLQDSLDNNLCYVHTEDLAKDSNLTITVILEYLKIHEELPPTLYLQLDNCSRENKNQYVFGFAGWLVQHDVFEQVKISFLMVGHTHDHIDQFFSVLQKYLNLKGAKTVEHLMAGLQDAHKEHNVIPELLNDVVLFREFISKYLLGMHNHTKPHHFHLRKVKNVVQLRSKFLSNTLWSDWSPIFESPPPFINYFKLGQRKEFDWEAQKDLISKHKALLTKEELQSWNDFLDDQGARSFATDFLEDEARQSYLLPNFVPGKPKLTLVPVPAGTLRSVLDAEGTTLDDLRKVFPEMPLNESVLNMPPASAAGPSGTVYHGKYRRLNSVRTQTDFSDCTLGSMICFLANHLSANEDTCPFWLGRVGGVLEGNTKVKVEWFARTSKTKPWEDSSWLEWYNTFTQEMYEALPEKQRTSANMKKIGKPHKRSEEIMDLDPSLVLFYGFKLTKTNKIPASTVKQINMQLKEQV